jgi:hypothetical protein
MAPFVAVMHSLTALGKPIPVQNRTSTAKEAQAMRIVPDHLKPAQSEVHKTAHDQDLIEVPKRARLDREAEHNQDSQESQRRTQVRINNL